MKRLIDKILILLVAVVAGYSCSNDMEFSNSGVSTKVTAISPKVDASIDLLKVQATRRFEWSITNGESEAITYQLVFSKQTNGEEIYRMLSENDGASKKIDISHSLLNLIAGKAGIESGGSGDVYWSVVPTKGMSGGKVSEPRKLTLNRYAGFDDVPVTLYITGSGTEVGANITDALQLRQTDPGMFEIYTELGTGTFEFTNRNSDGSMRKFIAEAGEIKEKDTPADVTAAGVYRIKMDFTKGTCSLEAVSDVMYYYPRSNTSKAMVYEGKGVWALRAFPVVFTSGDNRYKFKANIGGTVKTLGYFNKTAQESTPVTLEGTYFNIYENVFSTTGSNGYNYTYKFMSGIEKLAGVDIILDMSSGVENYTHRVDPGDITVFPVEQFTSPAEQELVTLNASQSTTFSWVVPAGGAGGVPPTYEVVFYKKDAGGEFTQIGKKPASNSGKDANASVSHPDLEVMAASAGIAAEGAGYIYWSVNTTILINSEIASITPRELKLKRLEGIPTEMYITGAASEFGATIASAAAMKNTASGEFEIHTKLTAGNYSFVDRTSGNIRTFAVTGTSIDETTTPTVATAGLYRIRLNFNTNTAKIEAISSVVMKMPVSNTNVTLTYIANGVWEATGATANFNAGWGDDRYYYIMNVGGVNTKYGWSNSDFNEGNDLTVKIPDADERYKISTDMNGGNADWDYAFKVWEGYRGVTAAANKKMDIKLSLRTNGATPFYYNYINYLN